MKLSTINRQSQYHLHSPFSCLFSLSPPLLIILLMAVIFSPLSLPKAASAQNPANEYEWVEYLYKRGETKLVISEGYRFLYHFPSHKRADSIRMLIGKSYYKEGRFAEALKGFQELSQGSNAEDIRQMADFWQCNTLFKMGDYTSSAKECKAFYESYPISDLRDRAKYIRGWSLLKEWKWDSSRLAFQEITTDSGFYESVQEILKETEHLSTLKEKSPAVAGVLSVLLPGSGYIYAGKSQTGLMAFLVNSAFIGSAIECFDNELPLLGAIISIVELGWYSGTVYGSINSARRYNYKLRQEGIQSLSQRFSLELLKLEF